MEVRRGARRRVIRRHVKKDRILSERIAKMGRKLKKRALPVKSASRGNALRMIPARRKLIRQRARMIRRFCFAMADEKIANRVPENAKATRASTNRGHVWKRIINRSA